MESYCLVIGAGAAGLSAGISFLRNFGKKDSSIDNCIILTTGESNSSISPWNIREKAPAEIRREIWESGNRLSDPEVLDVFVRNYSKAIKFLRELGVPLRPSNLGKVPTTRRKGSYLIKEFENLGGKRIVGKVIKFLINENKRIQGVKVMIDNQETEIIADQIIIASGGLANLYEYSTGCLTEATPSVLALALEAGIKLTGLEFNMFHPFLILEKNLSKVLISGELLQKARYVDERGNQFLSEGIRYALRNNKHHSRFPEMTREFYNQSLKSKVYMDISENSEEYFENYKRENEFGWIFAGKNFEDVKRFEIHPAFHFSMGGIKINKNAETNHDSVYAVGEAAAGLYGSSRIGGYAIPEALIFGEIAGKNAALKVKKPEYETLIEIGNSHISRELRKEVWENLGPVKKRENLKRFRKKLEKTGLSSEEKLVLRMIDDSLRRESLGAHFIE